MVLYEYVGKMLRKEGKIVVENVKKLMRKAMGIVLSVVLTLGCILGSGTIAWAEGETADAAAKIKVACVGRQPDGRVHFDGREFRKERTKCISGTFAEFTWKRI